MSNNYIYLKQSTDETKVGDLTTEGIITGISPDEDGFIIMQGTKKLDVCETSMFHLGIKVIQPLLIMDAPEKPIPHEIYISQYNRVILPRWYDEIMKLPRIPFHSNEQVFNYLKSKGIKPEAEMLIEFDGEIKIKHTCIGAGFLGNCEASLGECSNCHKVAIIKDTEVKQESEEEMWEEALSKYRELDNLRFAESHIVSDLKQQFKIERR